MHKIGYKVCPLCNSSNIEKRFSCKDHFATGEFFDIYKCSDCSFVFTQDVPDEKEIGRYYDTPSYVSHSNTDKGIINKLYHIVRRIMLRRKAGLVKRLTMLRNGRLLDYGAGIGYFAHAMKEADWDVTAIDKSPQARQSAKQNLGINIEPEEYLSTIEDGTFDVITMWHVMEHIQEIHDFWDTLYRILDESGILIIAVPNCSSYDAETYRENWAAYDTPRHLWHFTPSTIMEFGRRHKFILERQETMPFDGFYISMLSERYKGARCATLRGLWNGFLGWIASFDKTSASSSIIYVFRKRK